MKTIKLCLLIFLLQFVSACAVSSSIEDGETSTSEFDKAAIYNGERKNIQPPLDGVATHRIFYQGATGFTPVSAVRRSAMERVVEFCKFKGQEPYLIEETTSKPPHILGNWPRIEIVFSCIDLTTKTNAAFQEQDKYDQLRKLKSLLDDEIISIEEYENEKNKLLNK